MNHYRVEMFREKLKNCSISDYHGLISPGLTCYLNSVLQVLFMTEDFREAVKRSCSKDLTTIEYLRRLFVDLEGKKAETHGIIKMLSITDVYEQRDAAEYFEKILCLTSPEASKIFKGELNHKSTCCRCNKTNDSRSFFWILPLAMKDSLRQTCSVVDGLKSFFEVQKVCGVNQMYCSQCNKKRDADTEWELTQNPDVLTLLLKRFTFDCKRKRYVKLHCEADIPQTLHMEMCTYDLYAVVNHFGNLTGGHYTAEIKSFETGEWYCFDDNRVTRHLFKIGHNSLRSCAAYLLFYRKVSRHPETTNRSDQEAQCAHSDTDEERRDEAEEGEALKPRFYLNYDKLTKSHDDAVGRTQTNSLGHKQTNRRAAPVRQQTNTIPPRDNEAGRDNYSPNVDYSCTRTTVKPVERNYVKMKREKVAGKSVKQRTETNVRDMSDSVVMSCNFYSDGHPCASGIQVRDSYSQCRRNKATESNSSPNLCRNSNSLKRNKDKKQHVVNADSSCKPESGKTCEREKRSQKV
uniref:USP domain-containing protein n=1 Tax=Amphiprion percula TaxID=161767 RepID=A0A3P8SCB7_AMPPE